MAKDNTPPIKAGDLVRLKSGGPTMTVIGIKGGGSEDDKIRCQWFLKNLDVMPQSKVFVRAALEKMG